MGIKLPKKAIIAIPARLNSTRLPKKVLAQIGNKTMLERVIEQCKKSINCENLILCTDSEELKTVAKNSGINSLITDFNCKSGSERIASVINKLVKIAWKNYDSKNFEINDFENIAKYTLIINVQADQPFLDPSVIKKMINYCFEKDIIPEVVTPIYKLDKDVIHNPAVVKVLLNHKKKAIYFSRSALPFIRDKNKEDWHIYYDYWGHVGIYGFRGDILNNWKNFPSSNLEKLENLEQLRLIDSGIEISTFPVRGNFLSIDTQEQLKKAREIVSKSKSY